MIFRPRLNASLQRPEWRDQLCPGPTAHAPSAGRRGKSANHVRFNGGGGPRSGNLLEQVRESPPENHGRRRTMLIGTLPTRLSQSEALRTGAFDGAAAGQILAVLTEGHSGVDPAGASACAGDLRECCCSKTKIERSCQTNTLFEFRDRSDLMGRPRQTPHPGNSRGTGHYVEPCRRPSSESPPFGTPARRVSFR